jgi:hypothetical protein
MGELGSMSIVALMGSPRRLRTGDWTAVATSETPKPKNSALNDRFLAIQLDIASVADAQPHVGALCKASEEVALERTQLRPVRAQLDQIP